MIALNKQLWLSEHFVLKGYEYHSTSKGMQILQDKRWLTISNVLTVLRIILAPCVVIGIYYQSWHVAFALFFVASLTDFLDGYCARMFDEQTILGTVLDPLADKFLLICCFSSLAFLRSPSFAIPLWFFALILFRETIILLGSFVLVKTKSSFSVRPTIWGKLTTFFQLLFISWIFICYFFDWAPVQTYIFLLALLSIFSLLSLFQYIKIGLSFFIGVQHLDGKH